jgi:hypothetical protein
MQKKGNSNGKKELIFEEERIEENGVFAWKKKAAILSDGTAMKGSHSNLEKSQELRKILLESIDSNLDLSMPTLNSTGGRNFCGTIEQIKKNSPYVVWGRYCGYQITVLFTRTQQWDKWLVFFFLLSWRDCPKNYVAFFFTLVVS